MGTDYIKEVFDNYSQISIEEKKRLSERMIKVQNDDRCGDCYFENYYKLDKIDDILDIIIKGKQFVELYNSLTVEEKKEFQTRVYLTAANEDTYSYKLDLYKDIVKLIKTTKFNNRDFRDTYKVDFDRLEDAISYTEADFVWTAERVVAAYQDIASKRDIDSTLLELIETLQNVLSIIKTNVNESTNNKIDSISFDDLITTLLLILEVDKDVLDFDINKRKEERQKRDEYLLRKRENGIKEKKDSSKKLVKTKSNKYSLTKMR